MKTQNAMITEFRNAGKTLLGTLVDAVYWVAVLDHSGKTHSEK